MEGLFALYRFQAELTFNKLYGILVSMKPKPFQLDPKKSCVLTDSTGRSYRVGIHVFTVEEMKYILEHWNDKNRLRNKSHIKRLMTSFVKLMCITGDTIGFYDDGYLSDGQHRFEAKIKLGQSLEILVVCGIDPQARPVMGESKKRTLFDAEIMSQSPLMDKLDGRKRNLVCQISKEMRHISAVPGLLSSDTPNYVCQEFLRSVEAPIIEVVDALENANNFIKNPMVYSVLSRALACHKTPKDKVKGFMKSLAMNDGKIRQARELWDALMALYGFKGGFMIARVRYWITEAALLAYINNDKFSLEVNWKSDSNKIIKSLYDSCRKDEQFRTPMELEYLKAHANNHPKAKRHESDEAIISAGVVHERKAKASPKPVVV